MREASVTLQFVTPCLGGERGEKLDRFLRDPASGRVIFLNSWWHQLLLFGSAGLSKFQPLVDDVYFDVYVDGKVETYRRFYTATEYTEHEAFLPGTQVRVTVKTPDAITAEDLRLLLEQAGRYRGFSPYGWKKGFGRFVVVSVDEGLHDRNGKAVGEHTQGNPGVRDAVGS